MNEDLAEKIVAMVQEIMETDENIDINENLEHAVGMSSIDYIELYVAIEKDTGINIPENMFEKLQTVQSLIEFVKLKQMVN